MKKIAERPTRSPSVRLSIQVRLLLRLANVFSDAQPLKTSSTFPPMRPRDVVVNAGLSDQRGQVPFYEVVQSRALSTFCPELAEKQAVDGAEVIVTWGEEDGGSSKPTVERHRQTEVRATLCTSRPLATS